MAYAERDAQRIILLESADDGVTWTPVETPVAGAGPGGGLTDVQLRATPVPVSGTVATGALTDTQLRAVAVPVSGTVTATGPLTDTQLRAVAVPVSGTVTATGPLTDTQLRNSAVPVSGTVTASGPVTDAQLRAVPVPVSGTVATSNLPSTVDTNSGNKSASTQRVVLATDQPQLTAALKVDGSAVTQPVSGTVTASGPVTDTQIRATPLPVSGTVTANVGTGTQPVSGTFWQATQPVSGTVTANAGTGPFPVSDNAGSLTVDVDGNALASTTGYPPVTSRGQVVAVKPYLLTKPIFFWMVPSAVHAAAASTLFVDCFNADATALVRIMSIEHIVNLETAVTGVGFEWQLLRTTAVGTGGSAITAWAADTSVSPALDADITCRTKPTGGGNASTSLLWWHTNSEETLAGNQLTGGGLGANILPQFLVDSGQGILLRPSQGLRINQETNSNAGNSAFLIGFTVE